MEIIRVGLVGLGTVASGVLHILDKLSADMERRTGMRFQLTRFCSRTPARWKELGLDPSLCTTDAMAIAEGPNVDLLVELIGGVEIPRKVVLAALASGKHVVTANKALLSECGDEIFTAVERSERQLGFEASVCGGIPIIQLLKRSFAAERVNRIDAIVNGTCNFILTHMMRDRLPMTDVLAEAQRLGYAEADPTLDINGLDSTHKLAILAMLAWGVKLDWHRIVTVGIEDLSVIDIAFAAELEMVVKLLACARRERDGRLSLSVGPALVPASSVIGQVSGPVNAVLLDGEHVGPQVYTGAGAGAMPTATAVVADMVEIARHIGGACIDPSPTGFPETARTAAGLVPYEDQVENFYLRISALDQPGVLANVARALADQQISIAQVIQHGRKVGETVPVVIMTHEAKRGSIAKALQQIDAMPSITKKTVVMKVLSEAT